jgi:hypothetical protein
MMGVVADLISTNRKLLERVDQRLQVLAHKDGGNTVRDASAAPRSVISNPVR